MIQEQVRKISYDLRLFGVHSAFEARSKKRKLRGYSR
jgi:hypothetical protein